LVSFAWKQRVSRGRVSLGTIWNFSKGTELPWFGFRVWGTQGLYKGLGAVGLKWFEPKY